MKIINLPYTKNLKVIFNNLALYPWSIWLDSSAENIINQDNKINQKYDIISAFPYKTVISDIDNTIVHDLTYDSDLNIIEKKSIKTSNNLLSPFDVIKSIIHSIAVKHKKTKINEDHNSTPFWHGAIGYFGYDLNQTIFKQLKKQKSNNTPIMAVGIYAWALITDHQINKTYLAFDSNYINNKTIVHITKLLLSETSKSHILEYNKKLYNQIRSIFNQTRFFTPLISEQLYNKNFNTIKNHIKNGDCYQVNFAIPFSGQLNTNNDENLSSWPIYQYLRELNPNPFSCYFNVANNLALLTVMSFSPERFIQINNNIIITEPIKGTRKNITDNAELNNKNIVDLLNSDKERAENIMITDLMRNDLNKHCIPGSVNTLKICKLYTFPTVHHLISTVTGKLRPEFSSMDVFHGCFPGGSITGAPKIKAMEIIQKLENYDDYLTRYLYCGSIGYININNNLDTNITIRTVLQNNQTLYYWAGSGIVADSTCQNEYHEILTKIIKVY